MNRNLKKGKIDMSDQSPRESLPDNEFRQLLTEAVPYMRAFARGLTGDQSRADDQDDPPV